MGREDHGDELFGDARGGSIAEVFCGFLERRGRAPESDHPIYGARDFVFDAALPEPNVLPRSIYHGAAAEDRARFLELLRAGARGGVAFEGVPDADPDGMVDGLLASLPFTRIASFPQPAGAEVLTLYKQAWIAGDVIFRPRDPRGSCRDDAWPIDFDLAWGFLQTVALFRSLIGVSAKVLGARLGGNEGHHRPEDWLDREWWTSERLRVDFGRGVLFEPTFEEDRPWRAVFSELYLLRRERSDATDAPSRCIENAVAVVDDTPAGGAMTDDRLRYGHTRRVVKDIIDALVKDGCNPHVRGFHKHVYNSLGRPQFPSEETVRKYTKEYVDEKY